MSNRLSPHSQSSTLQGSSFAARFSGLHGLAFSEARSLGKRRFNKTVVICSVRSPDYVTTEPIFLDLAEDESSGTFYLGNYYAPSHPKFRSDTFSKRILDVKVPKPKDMENPRRRANMRTAVEYFRRELDKRLEKGFAIAIVPPSYHDTTRCKPHPDPIPILLGLKRLGIKAADAISVGDEPKDIQASKAAGVYSVGALWGTLDKEALRKAHPDALCEIVNELRTLILSRVSGE